MSSRLGESREAKKERNVSYFSIFRPHSPSSLCSFRSLLKKQKSRNASAAQTEGTAFDNASSSGDKNSDGEGSASRGGEATTRKPAATKATLATTTTTTDADANADKPSPSSSSFQAPPRAPASFYCPISMELMADPVVVATGHTYDRRCIERWLGAGHGTCPATGARLRHLELTPNFALRDAVAEWALREGVPVPQPEDGAGRTAAALLYKGGGGEEGGGGGSARGEGGSNRSRRAAVAAAAAAASRFAEEEAALAATTELEEEEEGEAPPRRRQQQQQQAATTTTAAAQNNNNADAPLPPPLLQQPPPTILRGHDEIVWAVEASKGRLFSASADRSVRVWDVASRRCEAVLEDHARPVLCLALAPAEDAGIVVDEEGDENAAAAAAAREGADAEDDEVEGGDLLFSGSYDFTIKVWSLRTLSRVKTLTGHADAVRSLLYVPPPPKKDGVSGKRSGGSSLLPLGRRGRLFSASYDGTVRVWDVATLEPVATLPGHSGPVRTLASVDGLVFSGSYDKTVRFFSFFFFFFLNDLPASPRR